MSYHIENLSDSAVCDDNSDGYFNARVYYLKKAGADEKRTCRWNTYMLLVLSEDAVESSTGASGTLQEEPKEICQNISYWQRKFINTPEQTSPP